MENLLKLDRILTGNNVRTEFFNAYEDENFKNYILDILPEIEDCNNQQQDNPWHIYNCLNHILCSVEKVNEQTIALNNKTRRMLSYVMLYHDLGKPSSYIRRYSKLYSREVDSFFGHNEKSEQIAKRTLATFGFDAKEIEVMCKLINKHDIFMFITLENDGNPHHKKLTKQLLQDEIDELNLVGDGKELFGYLLKVGRADNLAQNPKMTASSLKLLDEIEKLLGLM